MFQTLDLGCGNLLDHKRRNGVGLDLQRGACDVVGDVHFLPFQNNTFNFVYARNILEHLENPVRALGELKRVMKTNGEVSVTIPVFHNPCVDELLKLFSGFPFRLFRTVKRLIRWQKHRFDKGFWHKNRIKIKHIAFFFEIKRKGKLHANIPVLKIPYPFADINYVLGVNK